MVNILSILQKTSLFSNLTTSELDKIIVSSDLVELPANWEVIYEGSVGQSLYMVIHGFLQVYKTMNDNSETVLAQLGAGEYVGMTALLANDQRRNANVRTLEASTLLRIHKNDIQAVLKRNEELKENLLEAGLQQMRRNTLLQSTAFRALEQLSTDQYENLIIPDKTVIFKQGDPGDNYYWVVSGYVNIYVESDGQEKLTRQLTNSNGFGELALLTMGKRNATAIAEGDVEILQISGEVFRDMFLHIPEIQKYVAAMQRTYLMKDYGVVSQFIGEYMDEECFTTVYNLDNGRTVISINVIEQDIFDSHYVDEDRDVWETIKYPEGSVTGSRELTLQDNHIVGVMSYNLWNELGSVQYMMLKQIPITLEQQNNFIQTGALSEKLKILFEASHIVCECQNVSYDTILNLMQSGMNSMDDIVVTTGCTTVCGTCRPLVKEILGEGEWIPIAVTQEFEIIPNIRSFQFKSYGQQFQPAKPGQHLIIRAPINGEWVQRPYTITSPANEVSFREIIVKREPYGLFSNWMFDDRVPDTILQISEAQGDYFVELDQVNPIICFVAGVGITPAMGILRTMVHESKKTKIFVDYSASTADDFIHHDELLSLANEHDNISINARSTKDVGRISQTDITQIINKYPNATIYICGTQSYQSDVVLYLKAINIPDDRIRIESFMPDDAISVEASLNQSLSGRAYIIVGGVLLLAFLIQYTLRIPVPWLEQLQANNDFKIWSGLGLLIFIAYQWYLPMLRWQHRLVEASKQYHLHKIIGSLSPLVYFFHSMNIGYAYTFVLSLVFFGNFVVGLFNHELLPESPNKKRYANYWLGLHIILSTSMVSLILYHIFVVFAYN